MSWTEITSSRREIKTLSGKGPSLQVYNNLAERDASTKGFFLMQNLFSYLKCVGGYEFAVMLI